MKVIGIVSRKGGVGKSTLAIHFAELVARSGKKVALLDLDLQESCVNWRKRRDSKSVIVVRSSAEQLDEHLTLCREGSIDIVFIDTMPDIDAATKQVCERADFIVVPTRPSVMDLESVVGTLKLVDRMAVPGCVVFNLTPARGKEIRGARKALEGRDYHVAPTSIIDRVAYRRAIGYGEVAGSLDAKAEHEIVSTWHYIEKQMEAVA